MTLHCGNLDYSSWIAHGNWMVNMWHMGSNRFSAGAGSMIFPYGIQIPKWFKCHNVVLVQCGGGNISLPIKYNEAIGVCLWYCFPIHNIEEYQVVFPEEVRNRAIRTNIDNSGTVIVARKGRSLRCPLTDSLVRTINHVAVSLNARAYV